MLEYLTLIRGSLYDAWVDKLHPFLEAIRGSLFFWPVLVLLLLTIYFAARKFTR